MNEKQATEQDHAPQTKNTRNKPTSTSRAGIPMPPAGRASRFEV